MSLDLAIEYLQQRRADIVAISHDIWHNPELGLQEVEACRRQMDFLAAEGFTVSQPFSGLPTAFRAEWGQGGECFAIASEYDCLPEIGHACGHNLIAAAANGAACAIKAALQRRGAPGRLVVLGTPAEEQYGGKVSMVEQNCLAGVGAVMMVHPNYQSKIDSGSLAIEHLDVEFFGKAAHAGGSPELGLNALDAVIMLFNSVSFWRQQLPEDARVHGIIVHGGKRPNIIPDYTRCSFCLRSLNYKYLAGMKERFEAMIAAAASMTGCTARLLDEGVPYKGRCPNKPMNERYAAAMAAQGDLCEIPLKSGRGSSDFGDFSVVCPGIHPYFGIAKGKIPGHSVEFCQAAGTDYAQEQMLRAAAAMADIGLAFLTEPEFAAAVKADFVRQQQNPDVYL